MVNLTCGTVFCDEAAQTCSASCQWGSCGPKGYCAKIGVSGCKCNSYKP